ncbi:MAG TPA: 4-(cytidine 5'-diphospho)-2-C-methyl-D-erythritol kinase [Steroidobacteraceae bacterium]|jgi:4-diphosphocytidyl-2-C-methyl-D-erythritol kinase|nr:4-(cytidine 5'-diphospho)-2-C-methyl-D-erythritol kinase [Steroidobacteraceae bacterium]
MTPPPATRWLAPAKLNLFLHITGRRADGYHELQTLFQLVELCDTVTLELREDGQIERPLGPVGVAPEADLAVRAAHALKQATGARRGASIRIEKRIPLGAGLGGASSDAATTLLALNELWECGLPRPALARLALPLGADVPVFIEGSSAWAEGVGERLTPVSLPERWYLIIWPNVSISTRDVFQSPELTRNSSLITIRAFFEWGGRNDCEPVVRARAPEVAEALDWLAQAGPARLSGTGSCVFVALASAAEAERLAAQVPGRWTSFVARGLNTSPLHRQLTAPRRA